MLKIDNKIMDATYKHLWDAWSRETSKYPYKWKPETPGIYQDDVTALVTNDLFGGIIAVGAIKDGKETTRVHFNIIDDVKVDMTKTTDLSKIKDYMPIERETLYNLCATRYQILSRNVYYQEIKSFSVNDIPENVLDTLYDAGMINKPVDIIRISTISFDDLFGIYEVGDDECID